MKATFRGRLALGGVLLVAATSLVGIPPDTAGAKVKRKRVAPTKVVARSTTTLKRATPTTTTKSAATSTTAVLSAKDRVLAGYEAYLTAFVGAARQPERAKELLPIGMTGDALTRLLGIRRLDAAEGLYWDGTRADITSAPRVENIGETTATLRDCQSVGGVMRKRTTNAAVPETTAADIDDLRISLVLVGGKWLVTALDRFNDAEGRSKCVPGLSSQ